MNNPNLQGPVAVYPCSNSTCTSVPIQLGVDTPIYISFYGTGLRSASKVTVSIHGVNVPVTFVGPAPGFTGLDQVNRRR